MTAPKLVLHPAASLAAPAHAAIIRVLHDIGLIGPCFALDEQSHFFTGPDFLDGVSFLGCAPSIQLDPPAPPADHRAEARAGRFCHIQLHMPTDTPQLRHKHDQNPRCRRCRADISAQQLHVTTAELRCTDCGHTAPLSELNWRQTGGFARCFLDIWGIHTAEAVPSDRLLDGLTQLNDGPWQFFYIED
jgi:hypothetical protein